MRKKVISMLICVVALVALIAVYFNNNSKKEAQELAKQEAEVEAIEANKKETFELSANSSEEIQTIEIASSDSDNYVLELTGEDVWSVQGKENLTINQSLVNSMATSISTISSTEQISATKDNLQEFGLDSPKTVLTAQYTNGNKAVINIGASTPAKDNFYVTAQGTDGIYLIGKYTINKFLVPLTELIDKTIAQPNQGDLKYISYKIGDKAPIEIENKKDLDPEIVEQNSQMGVTALVMKSPLPDRNIYDSYFQEYFYALVAELKLDSVVELSIDEPSRYGLDNPTYELIVEDSETMLHLTVGSAIDSDFYYCMYEGRAELFSISQSSISALMQVNTFGMIEKFVTIPNIDNVEEFIIINGAEKHTAKIERETVKAENEDEEDEVILKPTFDGIEIEEDAFKLFYRILIGITYDAAAEPGFIIEDEPEFTIIYKFNNGDADITDEYYEYNTNFYIVRQNNVIQDIVTKKNLTDMYNSIESLKNGTLKD